MNRPVSRQVNIDELGNLPIGTPLQLEPLDAKVKGLRLKSALIGLEHQEYMILKMPRIILGGDNKPQNNNADPVLADGDKVVIKYMFNGTIYAFESNVMSIIDDPVKQLYICYPETLREQNLRQSIVVRRLRHRRCWVFYLRRCGAKRSREQKSAESE